MPYTPSARPSGYHPSPSPTLPGSDKLYVERELKAVSRKVNELAAIVREMQEWLENNTV